MRHPFRRYCYHLAQKLGKHVHEIMELPSSTIAEWMAYDMTLDPEWIEKFNKEEELRRQRDMSNEERARLFRQLLGGM